MKSFFNKYNKRDIESILLVNSYFTICKIENPSCPKTELTRKYLTTRIKKALNERNEKYSFKAFLMFFIL
jgi:hypothetical protein